ncbi:phosphodiester glycosidase family protein [Neobacillus sp. PS3-34]|uniref:phosphodiester glycosidase family protein n=1 Tax=Neobacillus sp. PS3-34 TaxID=3070678 RepID=UPI0027DF718A|nr:phosphodiester glycosidase family protein [Neobacillus sp. PS3-34]WML46847.1 phosphodiester glycosidase family protein [Neobacillus sp. PS3-34]
MNKKVLICFILLLAAMAPSFSGKEAKAAAAPVVMWDGMQLLKGQVGRVDIIKPINLWKKENNKLVFERVLKPGEKYRVYQYSSEFGGQYGLGGPYFVTKMQGFIDYRTPSLVKLKLVNPEAYGTKLSLGAVTNEKSTVIAPGVTQSHLSVESNSGDHQQIYVLGVDQKASEIKFETTLAKDQMIGFETVSSMAERHQAEEHYVIGGVNGDYFDSNTGAPTDLTVHDGEVVTTNTTPASERTIFGVTPDGKAMIGNPEISLAMTVNGQKPYVINSVNKRRFADHLVLYTPYFASTTMTNDLGTEVVLNNIQGQLNGNNTVKATVKEVFVGKGSTPTAPGEFILSGHGKANEYLKTLAAGDQVDLNVSYDNPAWSQVEQAIGGRYYLVKNGQAQSFNIGGTHPRTAIGIKKDGSVFVMVIDGRQNESGGVSLTDLAKLMKDLGAVESMTFDGGGSSTMIARQPGDSDATVINSPSDGSERRVANSLMIVGTWKAGPLNALILSANDLKLFAGANYKNLDINVKGLDKNNNPITVNNQLAWTSTVGTFNSDGSFTAGSTLGKGTITAASGTVKASVPVEITNQLDRIDLGAATAIVDKNGSLPLSVAGYLAGKKVVEDPSVFKYTLSAPIGTIENGVFKAGNTDGSGIITVSYGAVSAQLQVIVGNPGSIVVENFENTLSSYKASGARYTSILVSTEKNYIKDGSRSLKVAYDFSGTTGTSGVYATPAKPIAIPGAPVKIGMWVYGDGKGHWLRSQLTDAVGKEIQLDFTKNLNWLGWKYVEAAIPAGFKAPYKMVMPVRYMETSDLNKNKGQIFVDQITAIY